MSVPGFKVWEIKEHRRLTGRLEMGRNLWEAAENGDVQRLEDILPFLTTDQMNYPGGVYGWTALSAAVHSDHAEAVRVLLTFGANPDWQDGDGDNYPVHWACSAEVASILVEAGTHVGKRNRLGETAADASRRCRAALATTSPESPHGAKPTTVVCRGRKGWRGREGVQGKGGK